MRHTRGFSLLEVLIVVTIVSAIATIAIPGLLNAMHRGRQGATIADMRTIATALERYAVDNQSYPAVEEVQELAGELEPEYIKEMPLVDGWNHPYAYEADQRGTTYTLRSPGKDGELQNAELIPITHDFAADIVCVDGVFVQRPVGRQGEEDDDTEPSEPLGAPVRIFTVEASPSVIAHEEAAGAVTHGMIRSFEAADCEDPAMLNTYRALLRGSRLEWREQAPPEISEKQAVPVEVTVLVDARFSSQRASDTGERMAAALEKLAASGAVSDIEDPVGWQREIRRDRPLPGRS